MCRFSWLSLTVALTLAWQCGPPLAGGQEAAPAPTPASAAAPAPKEAKETADKSPEEKRLTWLTSLKAAYAQAQQDRRPILVVVGGAGCPFCRVLKREMERPEAAKELARWTLAELDLDRDADDIRPLAVGPIPALRVLTAAGKTIAARDGAMSAEDLALWLGQQFDAAAGAAPPDLAGSDTLTVIQAVRLVREFRRRDPTIREAAIRRLLPHPQVAAGPVLTAFSDGPLSTRLAALELLEAWKAPVEGLDPWRPGTLSAERLATLTEWAAKVDPAAATAVARKELTDQERKTASDTIRQMLAATPSEATAIRERLARYGAPLLPEVYRLLQETESDDARERLTALRYRLVATDQRVLSWPGGIERLASSSVATRQQALDELARQATPADEPLLLELFSDPEPLVRELSLRALHQVGGAGAQSALTKLLDDPDPNVRAAVLKQLAESAARAAVPRVIQYVAKEKDADLLVHAVRVLREAPSKASLDCLTTLLAHESWRVRAEAAEAIGKAASGRESISDEDKADAYVALVELLKDEDAFVVSRAVEVLGKANLVVAVDPLAQVALRHPDLAAEVVKSLTTISSGSAKAEGHLRKFCGHENPKVRAAAIGGLCQLNSTGVEAELRAALADKEPTVRAAAALAVFEICQHEARSASHDPFTRFEKSQPAPITTAEVVTEGVRSLFNLLGTPIAAPADDARPPEPDEPKEGPNADEAVKSIRDKFPKWLPELVPLLTPLLNAEGAEERVAAALALTALGEEAKALPVLQANLSGGVRMIEKISPALFWLEWEGRKTLYQQLVGAARNADVLAIVASAMAERHDPRAADPIWSLLGRPDVRGTLAGPVATAIRQLYYGDRYYDLERVPARQKKLLQEEAKRRAQEGPRWQRLVAFSLLIDLAPEEAVAVAQPLQADEKTEPQLRSDILRVLLVAQDKSDAQKTALAALASPDDTARRTALDFLARGSDAIGVLDGGSFELSSGMSRRIVYGGSSERTPIPELPKALKPEILLPLLESGDAEQAAEAGYLLCLLDRPEGFTPLLAYWRQHARRNEPWTRLVYQAVAVLDAHEYVPVLDEIYRDWTKGPQPDHSRLATLYWTIRDMTGPEVLALRKRMRDEIGMDNLRSYDPFGRGSPY